MKAKKKKTSPVMKNTKNESSVSFLATNFIPLIVLFLLAIFLYVQTIPYEYVLDDKIVLSENNFVKKGFGGLKEIFTTESFTGYLGQQQDLVVGARYRPLSIATFAMEYQFFGLNPKISHIVNIFLYGLTAILLFRILAMMFPMPKEAKWYWTIPFVATLLFVVHPTHSEAIANIKGRDEIMVLLLSLLALYYAMSKKPLAIAWSCIAFFFGLLAKENALTFLAVIPASLYVFQKASMNRILKVTMPLVAVSMFYIAIRYNVIGYLLNSGKPVTGLMNNPFLECTTAEKFATIFYTLILYIKLLIFPHPLTHDYYPYQVPIMNWSNWQVLVSFFFYCGIGFYALLNIGKRNITAYAILWFIATLSIVSNILFPVGTFMNERFIYIPSVAFCFLVAYWLIDKLPNYLPKQGKLAGQIFLGIVVLLFMTKTTLRLPAWENEMTLNRAASTVSTGSARANSFMAYSLYVDANAISDRTQKKALFDEATPFVDRALEIHPTYPDAIRTKGGILAGYYQMDNDLQKLLDGFYKLLEARPVDFIDQYLAYLNKRGANPQMMDFYHKVSFVNYIQNKKDYANAVKYATMGYNLEPSNYLMLYDLAVAHYFSGNYQQTVNFGSQALAIKPTAELQQYVQDAANK